MGRKIENVYTYDGERLTRDELLQKPEILKYLRRNGLEKNVKDLHDRFYKEFKKGNIIKEIVLGLERKPKKHDYSKRVH